MWITGASTGIGREAARQLAAAGVKVAASARTAGKLEGMGDGITGFPLDVTDAGAALACVKRIESELGNIDLAILGAGTYQPVAVDNIDPVDFARMVSTNYLGVVNCLAALAPGMLARKAGHVSWIASVAGYSGLPKAAAYGPTKAALINLAESLRPEMARAGVAISVVNLGFVRTPMTAQNDFEMPFVMTPEEAARRMLAGLRAGRFEIAYPRRFTLILKALRMLPYPLYFRLIERLVLK